MAWGVGIDSLVTRSEHGSGECVGSAGSVVGDCPFDSGDAVSGEPRPGAMNESDGCSRFLVCERFGLDKAGVTVDGRCRCSYLGGIPTGAPGGQQEA
jgi:hypothetical protein